MEKADILIHDCTIVPMNREELIKDGIIAIKDNKIAFVGKRSNSTNIHAEKNLNAKGKIAMPGLINCHTHIPMTLFRGIAEDQKLNNWLKKSIWPLEAKLNSKAIYIGAILGCLEMIKSGTTCFADMYFMENMVARAVEKSGMRGVLAEGIIELGIKTYSHKLLEASTSFAESFNKTADGRITTLLAPHSVYSCSLELLIKVRKKASELGIGVHIHLAESKKALNQFETDYYSSEVDFLEKIGFLKGHTLAAHCINLSPTDRHLLSKHNVNVVYNPVANMKFGLGTAKIKELVDLGINVGLGTDGPASNNSLDMFETLKIAALLQKHLYLNPKVFSPFEVLKMATLNGAKALKLEKSIGSLETGKKADIILINLSKPHLKPLHNIYASIIYSIHGSDVDTVIVDGKILMINRRVKTLEEQAIMESAEKTASDLLLK